MNEEVEYVVPPANTVPRDTINSNAPSGAPKPPKKPSALLSWVKTHKFLTTACIVMVGLVGLVSTVLITGQQVSVFGLQLNPLYNSAAPCSPSDCPDTIPTYPDDGGTTTPTTPIDGGGDGGTNPTNPGPSTNTSGQQTAPNGFQVSVRDNGCSDQERTSALIGAGSAGNVTDANAKDPDCARISFNSGDVSGTPDATSIYTQDFRIGTRVAESENGCTAQIDSSIKWSPWASDGGGTSPQAVGTASSNDPDCVWLHYETRPMPAGKGIRDVRVGIASGGAMQFTPWARAGGGNSAFSTGGNIRPTSVGIDVQLITISNPPVVNPPAPTNPNIPDIIAIVGTIPNSIVNQSTIATFTLSRGTVLVPCTWTLVSVTPNTVRGAKITANGNGTTATFDAVGTAVGTYQVMLRATCQNGQVTDVTAPWTVTAAGPGPVEPTPGLIITGTFPAGTVGQSYTTNVQTARINVGNCDWKLDSIVPSLSGATVNQTNNVIADGISRAQFSATPQTATLYKVTITARCDTGTAQNTFDWVVGKATTPGGGGTGGGGNTANSCLDQAQLNKLSAIYRYWSPAKGDHLYTTNANEKPAGYRFEGISGYVFATQVANTSPIYRSNKADIGAHYYSTTNDATNYGYTNEGILGYAYTASAAGSSAWFRMHKGGDASDYVHTISVEEKNAIKELGYADEGTVAYICGGSQPTELQPVFRLWGAGDGDHFYTTNFSERDSLLTKGYISEGITGYIYGVRKEGSVPLYRAYSRGIGDHLYTATEAEARGAGYSYEGVMGYIAPSDNDKTTPIYRLYNAAIGDHFYTASADEAAAAIRNGYKGEGITGYLYLSQ